MHEGGKRALALSGGGFTGYLFEIGALTALDDLWEDQLATTDFDLYVGVSAGAAAAALLANGVKPEEVLVANLAGERPYYFERKDIFAPAMGEGLKTFLRAAQRLWPLLQWYVRNRKEMSLIDLLDKAQDALPSGVYTLEPFARYLEATFAAKWLSNTFEALPKELYIPAIDLETGECVIFGEEGRRDVPISRAITASSAAPIYFCPVRIQGRDYLDAGIGRITFFEVAMRKGADLIVVINPMVRVWQEGSTGQTPQPRIRSTRLRDRGLLTIGDQATRINLEARFSLALDLFRREYPQKTLLVISPQPTDTLLFERSFLSFKDRVQLLRCGYLAAVNAVRRQLPHIRERLAQMGMGGLPTTRESREKIRERLKRRTSQFAGQRAASPAQGPVWSHLSKKGDVEGTLG